MTEWIAAEKVQIGDRSEGCVAQAVGWREDGRVEIEWTDDKGGRAVLPYEPKALVKVSPATETVRITVRGGEIRVEVEENVGPLGAFRSRGAAAKCLASFADVAEDRTGDGVTVLDDLDGSGRWHVPFIAYPRPVRR